MSDGRWVQRRMRLMQREQASGISVLSWSGCACINILMNTVSHSGSIVFGGGGKSQLSGLPESDIAVTVEWIVVKFSVDSPNESKQCSSLFELSSVTTISYLFYSSTSQTTKPSIFSLRCPLCFLLSTTRLLLANPS